MKKIPGYLLIAAFILLSSNCSKTISSPVVEVPDYSDYQKPLAVDNNIVAHRGAYKIKNAPQNSVAAFKDAIEMRLFAVECDIQITADKKVIMYHDPTFKGLTISKTPLAELRAAGKLANNEEIPLFEDFVKTALEGKYTKMWVDVKLNAAEYGGREAARDACLEAMSIARKMKAIYFVEFLITNEFVMQRAQLESKGDFQMAYQTADAPNTYTPRGFTWASQSDETFYPNNAARIQEFKDRGIKISIYMADNVAIAKWFIAQNVYGITTNDPEMVLKVTRGEL